MIYFVRDTATGFIKIGYTRKSLFERLCALQVGCPTVLELLGTMPGGIRRETSLHQRFIDDHVRGEWFKPSAALMRTVARLPRKFEAGLILAVQTRDPAVKAALDSWAGTWREHALRRLVTQYMD